ncbi:hypothetical protein [Bacillus altitudinis]|uniref:hypothetical protein n=1 Tax=Bacillus altitudinis TaxID=293387 RepID=UPI003981C9C2
MIGQIVKWIKDTSSNIVWEGDIAVALENERFLGIKGTVKDKFFFMNPTRIIGS